MSQTIRKRLPIYVVVTALLLSVAVALLFSGGVNKAAAADTSIFIFTKTGDSECSVRLVDKTVTKAVVPTKAKIDGIEYTVTSVAANGFMSAANLQKVRLPRSVTTIGTSAFANCKKLNSVTLPAVTSIGTNAFNTCQGLSYLIIPKTVTTVGSNILRSTSTQVYVRASQDEVAALDWSANWNASNANQDVEFGSVYVPEIEYSKVESASTFGAKSSSRPQYIVDGNQPFSEMYNYGEVHIPATYTPKGETEEYDVVGIDQYAFEFNSVEQLIIDYAPTAISIGDYAFYCLETTAVVINREIVMNPEEDISSNVFAGSTATTIILPNTISDIGTSMFDTCSNLFHLDFITPQERTAEQINALLNEVLLEESIVNIPATVTEIGEGAFNGTYELKVLNIADTVTKVNGSFLVEWSAANGQTVNVEISASMTPPGWSSLWNASCSAPINYFGDYTITYHLSGGSNADNPETYHKYTADIVFNDPVLLGHTFEGWYGDAEFTTARVYTLPTGSKGAKELFAKWTKNQYGIRYDANKPASASALLTGNTENSSHIYSITSPLRQNGFQLTGWTFVEWNTEADGSGIAYSNLAQVTNLTAEKDGVVTLFAQWQQKPYTIEYHQNKPAIATEPLLGAPFTGNYIYDEYISLPGQIYHLKGWTFTGWNTAANGSGVAYAPNEGMRNPSHSEFGTVTLYAQWRENHYHMRFVANKPADALTEITPESVPNWNNIAYESTVYIVNYYELEGWAFDGWLVNGIKYRDGSYVSKLESTDGGVCTLISQWRPLYYTVDFWKNSPTERSNREWARSAFSISKYYFNVPRELDPNRFTLKNWSFVEWNTKADGTGTAYADKATVVNLTMKAEPFNLYAQWEPNDYTIKYERNKPQNASHEVIGNDMLSTHKFQEQTQLIPNVYSLQGWTFKYWTTKPNGYGDRYLDGQQIYNLAEDDETFKLYAQWEPFEIYVHYYENKPTNSSQDMMYYSHDPYFIYDIEKPLQILYEMRGWRLASYNTNEDGSGTQFDPTQVVSTLSDTPEAVKYQLTYPPYVRYSLKLYAQWEPIIYSIYGAETQTGSSFLKLGTYTVEDAVILESLTPKGWIFHYSMPDIPKGQLGDYYTLFWKEEIRYTVRVRVESMTGTLIRTYYYNTTYFNVFELVPPRIQDYQYMGVAVHYGTTPNKNVHYTGQPIVLTQLDDIVNGFYDITIMYRYDPIM